MKYSNTVEYNIKTSLDSKGLTQLKSELQGLELKLQNMGNKGLLDEKTFSDARNQIQGLGQALSDAFNPSLGMLDLSKLNQELKNNDVTAQGLKTAFSSLGAEGQVAFNNLVGELGKLDTGILRTNSQIDKLFTTFSNTFRWGLVSSFFSQFMNAIHSSIDYVKDLDDSLTQIMLVTDYNRDSMNQFAKSANEAAKAVSMTTTGMTNASLIFAQQGYDLNQSQQLATLSAKLANASQQDTATTSDQITAYMNAYGLEDSIEELTQQMDNWALIANVSAADVGELAQASQRAASMANAVGVNGEQLAAQIATIESVTREAPEQIGNGLKTLYARFSDISKGGEDEDGFGLGDVTSQLQAIGVQIFDQMGQIRDVGDIMEDLMVIWDDLDQTSKVAASQALAGKYQVNRFMALMDNSDMYQEYKGATGSAATGTLDQMNEEFANSIEGRSAKLQASLEGLFSTIFNTDDIYPWMDAAQGAVDLLQEFFDALGGGKTVLLGISSLLMQVFSKNMAQEINNAATNRAVQQQKLENLQNSGAALSNLGLINPNTEDQNAQNILDFSRYMNEQALAGNFNPEQMNQANNILAEMVQNSNAATMAANELKDNLSTIGTAIAAISGDNTLPPFLDEQGAVNASELMKVLQQMDNLQIRDFFSDLEDKIGPVKKDLLDFNSAIQNYQKELNNANSTSESFEGAISEMKAALDRLQGELDVDTYNRYEQALDEISNKATDAKGDTSKLAIETAKLAEELAKVSEKDLRNLDHLDQQAFKVKTANSAAEDSSKVAGAFKEGMSSQSQIKEILDTFNAVQQLTFAWQAFQNLGSLWANEDLSTGEKVLQTIMNLTMAMPQLISALQTLQNMSGLKTIGNAILHPVEMIKNFSNEANNIKKIADEAKIAQNALDTIGDGLKITAKAGAEASQAMLTELNGAVAAGETATSTFMGMNGVIGKAMASAAAEGATGLGVLGAAAKAALAEFWPFLLIGAAIAGIAAYIGAENEKAQKAKEEALEAFDEAQSKLEEMQALQEKANNFQTNFESKKSEGTGFEGLADEARDLADALVEAGHASESANIRLAATKAAALGTEEAYQELADTVKTASLQAEMDTNTDAQRAAIDVLNTQKADLDEIAQKQATLRDLKEQLNNLDQESSRRGVLENRIEELEEYISKNQEAVEAANQLREAQAANVGLQLSQETSDTVHSSGVDDATKRAGTYQEYTGTYDYDTLNAIYSQNVADWDKYSELEKIDIMLHTLQDDAQIAAVEIEQILQTNSSIKDMGYAGQGITAEEQRNNITGALENTGLSAEQNLQLMATFDKDATYKEIMDGIAEVQQGLKDGEDFDVLLKAKFNPEQIGEGVKEAINAYEPIDEDVDVDAFKNMANYIQGADASAFEEGGMLEDISPDIQSNAEALEELVEGILRYDDAISTLAEKEEDWRNALADDASLQDRTEAVADLKETYSDFLDLGTDVSDTFAENTQHLDDMAAAAEGDVDAYNRLLAAASEDIAINVYGVEEGSAALEEMSNYLQSDAFQDVEVGMAINDDAFYDALNKMSEDAGWTAEDMENYLSDIGCSIDPSGFEETANSLVEASNETGKAEAKNLEVSTTTTVESATGSTTDTHEATSLEASEGPGITLSGTIPSIPMPGQLSGGQEVSGGKWTAHMPDLIYTATPVKTSEEVEKTGYAVNTKAKQGDGGNGGVQVKKGSIKKNNSGGAKNKSAPSRSSSGGGGGGRSCFVAGTLISTSLGFKPIEQIQKEDIVLSYNRNLRINEYSKVLQTMIHNTIEPIYTLYIKDEQLRVTGIHRFLTTDKITCGVTQWTHAADLKVGNWVLFADGTWHVIWKIEVNIEHQTVYNFEVSGNHNYYVGHDQILAHNKGGKGGGGKGGSGGGGGSAKTIQPKEKKKHEKNYYEEVDNQLKKVEKVLSGIEKEEDRLVGDKARANQNKQLKLLQKEILLQQEKLKILTEQEQKDVTKKLKDADKEAEDLLKKYINFDIPAPVYDEDGIIANYEQISQAIDDAHNRMIEEYNKAAAAGDEELTKQIEKDIQNFDKLGESILKNAQRSNAIQSEIEEIKNTIEDLDDAMEDIAIDAYKKSQEAIDKLKELNELAAKTDRIFRKRDDNSFMNRFSIDETPYDKITEALGRLNKSYNVTKKQATEYYDTLIAQKKKELAATSDKDEQEAIQRTIKYYNDQKKELSNKNNLDNGLLGLAQQDLQQLNKWVKGEDKETNPFGENTAALYEALEEAQKRVVDLWDDYEDNIKEVRDGLIDLFDEQEHAIERNLDKYDTLLEDMERMSDVTKLWYGEDSYDKIIPIMKQQESTMKSEYAALQTAYNHWVSEYQAAIKIGDDKLIEEVEDKMNDAREQMMDKAQELAEFFVEEYETAVENSIKTATESVWGKTTADIDKNGNISNIQLGLEDQTAMWELQKDYMDRYKDDVEKGFEIDKLRSKYQDLLNDAQGMSLQTQNRIRAQMQEQLDLLEGQKTMSEYDVKLANAKLEILQKQIALEDAQRNKNKMQLRRDTQGNYRYVYTADRGDVKKAQDELTESQYDAYEMTKQETIANNDRAINLYNDYMNKMREIANKYKDDDVARNAAMKALSEEYGKLLEALGEDFKDTTNGMYDILCWMVKAGTEDTAEAAKNMMTSMYDENGKILDNTDNKIFDLANRIEEKLPDIQSKAKEAIQGIETEADILKEKMVGTNGSEGIMKDINLGAASVEEALGKVTDQTTKWKEETQKLFESFSSDNPELINAKNQLTELENQLKTNSDQTSSLRVDLDEAQRSLSQETENRRNWETKAKVLMGAEDFQQGQTFKLTKDLQVFYAGDGDKAEKAPYIQTDKKGNRGFTVKKGTEIAIHNAHQKSEGGRDAYYPIAIFKNGQSPAATEEDNSIDARQNKQMWHVNKQMLLKAISYDTGGYTGSWTDNTLDRKNGKLAMLHQKELVLNAQDTQNILQATQIIRDVTSSFSGRMNSLFGTNGSKLSSGLGDTIEQRVEINASFPNATDADDIRNALLGLADKAYQYAHRSI